MEVRYGQLSPVLEIKAAGDSWEVSGHVSTWGNIDAQGDVVLAGAFTETLKSDRKVKFLMGHDSRLVLGTMLELKEDKVGLFGRFKISRTQLGTDVHTLLKDGALDSFSIGYIPTDYDFDDQGVRMLKEIDLLECSVVAIPANDMALVTGVKSDDLPSLAQIFKSFKTQIASWKASGTPPDPETLALLQAFHASTGELLSPKVEEVEETQAEAKAAEAPVLASPTGLSTRLELMRRRLKRKGILEPAS